MSTSLTRASLQHDQPITIVAESAVIDLHRFLADTFAQVAPTVRWVHPNEVEDPSGVDVAVCWYASAGALRRYTGLQLVQSLGAGMDHLFPAIEGSRADLPLCRVVDPLMTQAMANYVTWTVLHQQRKFDVYARQQTQALWAREPVPAASAHCVGIAGLGQLGLASARALLTLGFRVRGWARSNKPNLPEKLELFLGTESLDAFVSGCDSLVCLLPLTPETVGFIGERVLALLPPHGHVINVARGEHVDEAALLAALDAGRIGHATLDTFAVEPLPAQHRFWVHPRVTITPHVAARATNAHIVRQLLSNLQAVRAGERPITLVDRALGY